VEPPDQAARGNRKPAGPARAVAVFGTLTLFGFAQLDFAGTLALADGRYVVRDNEGEHVLVLQTLSALPAPRRKRRARVAVRDSAPTYLPLSRATIIPADAHFDGEGEASRWLEQAIGAEDAIDRVFDQAVRLLNRALHASAVASGEPAAQEVSLRRAARARLGFGSGEEVAEGAFTHAHEVDPRTGASPRRRRAEELRPQERVAAVLGGRERIDLCETLILRARADLVAGRDREAALQLRAGLGALLVELAGAVDDPGHETDMAALESRRDEALEAADAALRGDLDWGQLSSVRDLVGLCERVLRRRRVLSGG
jgi:hypothetical protein